MKRRATTTMRKRLRKHATVRAPRYHAKRPEFRIVSCPSGTWMVQRFHKDDQKDGNSRTFDPWRSMGKPTTFDAASERMHILASTPTA